MSKHTAKRMVAAGLAVALWLIISPAARADSTKADNNTDLNLTGAWLNGIVPGNTDIALWDSNLATAANGTVSLGAVGGSLTFGQIKIANPAGPIVINDTNDTTSFLTLNGVGGVGIDMSSATTDLTIGSVVVVVSGVTQPPTNSLRLAIGGNQSWLVPTGRTLLINGSRGIDFGNKTVTVTGGGTLNVSYSNNPAQASTSTSGAGLVINGSALSITVQANGASSPYLNYLGANTSLTMAGGTMVATEASTTGAHSQTFTSLNLNPGFTAFNTVSRANSSANQIIFNALARNAGSSANFGIGSVSGSNKQCYSFLSNGTILGFATFGLNDFVKTNGSATNLSAPTYTNDTWASANNTTVTTNDNFSASSALTTNSLRFNAVGGFTVTLPAAVNTITTGGILIGGTVTTNDCTITGGSLTSGNSGLYGGTGADLIVTNNTGANAAAIVNSNIVDNGATAVGLTKAGAGALKLGGTNTFSGPSYINAGSVVLTSASAWNGQSAINFAPNGLITGGAGSLSLGGNSITTKGLNSTQAGINPTVQNASSTPATLTVNLTSGNNTYTGAIQDGGAGALSLVKQGGSTLSLTGSNAYTGATTVSAGTLSVTQSINTSSAFSIAGGAVLDVSGVPGGLTVSSGKTLTGSGTVSGSVTLGNSVTTPGVNGAGTLSITSLAANSGSQFNFGLLSGTPTNNLINVTGSGGLSIANPTFNLFQSGTNNQVTAADIYDLFQYTGTAPSIGGLSQSSILNPVSGLSYSFGFGSSGPNNYVQLTISGVPQLNSVWAFDTSGNWSDGTKWSTNPNVPHSAGDTASFTTALAAPRTVTLNGSETVGVINFNSGSAANGYAIAPGTGTLTINNSPNAAQINVDNSGGTAGNHVISTPLALGSNLSVKVTNANDSLTLSGGIASTSASIAKIGAGTLALSNTNSFSGGLSVTGGAVQFTSLASLGTGTITLDGGGLKWSGNNQDISSLTITLGASGGTLDTNTNNVTLSNPIGNSGSGGLTKAGSGTLALGANNTYSGATTVAGGTLSVDVLSTAGSGRLGTSSNAAANLVLNGGTLGYTGSGDTTDRLLTLGTSGGAIDSSGAGALVFGNGGAIAFLGSGTSNTLTLRGSDTTGSTFTPSIGNNGSGATNLTKLDGGTWILPTANTFSGTTTVTAGTLQLISSLALQNSTVTMNGGAIDVSALANATFGGLTGTTNLTIGTTALTIGGNNANTSYSGVIVGTADLTKNGSGTTTFSGASTLPGALTINNGTLTFTTGANAAAPASIALTGGSGLSNLIVSGSAAINCSGQVTVGGTANGNSLNGGTISAGTLILMNGASLSASSFRFGDGTNKVPVGAFVTVQDTASLTVTGNFDLNRTIATSVGSNCTLNLNGGTTTVGAFIATNTSGSNHPYTINFNGGTLRPVATNASFLPALPTLTARIQTGGAIIDTNGFDITIGANLVGATGGDGGLLKNGTGNLTLAGTNTFKGDTKITGGTVLLANSLGLENSTLDYNSYGGTLVFNSISTATLGGLKGSQSLALTNDSANDVALTVGNNDQSNAYSGVLSGGILASVTKIGAGVQTLTGNNTYAGPVEIDNGALSVDHVAAVGAAQPLGQATSAVLLGSLTHSGTLQYTGVSASLARDITLNSVGGGKISNTGGGTLTLTGTLTKNGATLTLLGGNIVVNGKVTGPSANSDLVVDGNASVTLNNGTNDYNGATTVNSGSLTIGHVLALGSAPALNINGTATATLASGLSAPLQLNSLSITGGMMLPEATGNDMGFSGVVDNAALSGAGLETPAPSVQAVPEPSAVALAAFGVTILGIKVLRRRQDHKNKES